MREGMREGSGQRFDAIMIGGGHAGLEAAWIMSQFKLSLALFTMPGVPLGSMPCNPAIGGVGKGQVVRELDALGGIMGILADWAGIQFRILNESKGHAVRSTRTQVDKDLYSQMAEKIIDENPYITVIRHKVLLIEEKKGKKGEKGEKSGFQITSESKETFFF